MSARRERAVMREVPNVSAPPPLPEAPDFKVPTARGILSREEIQALLRPDLPSINDEGGAPRGFDEELEPPVDKNRLEGQRFAARFSRAFGQSAGLKAAVSLNSAGDFQSKRELLKETGEEEGGAFATFGDETGDVTHVIRLSAALSDHLIANACGALTFEADPRPRRLSVIDCALLEQFLSPFARMLGEGISLVAIETNPTYVMSLLSTDCGTRYRFDVDAAGRASTAALWSLTSDGRRQAAEKPRAKAGAREGTALLTARIASLSVPVSRVSALKAGDTLLLGLPADQPVELLSGGRDGRVAYEGDVGRKGDRMAVRVRRCA